MKLTLLERSECFRGFLLLIAQDRVVSPEEKELLHHIGKVLDFEKRFCEEAMDDLLDNVHIVRTPPVFSQRECAEAFLYDCIRIARSDHDIHPEEMEWLDRIAEANGLGTTWVGDAVGRVGHEKDHVLPSRMEIEAYI